MFSIYELSIKCLLKLMSYTRFVLQILVKLKKSDSFRGLVVSKRGKRRILKEKCGNLVLCILVKSNITVNNCIPRLMIIAYKYKMISSDITHLKV